MVVIYYKKHMEKVNFIFDFDSTLVKIESLDEVLALSIGQNVEKLEKLSNLTKLGMEGKITFKESLEQRLQLSNINKELINIVMNKALSNFTDGINSFIDNLLTYENVNVFVVSGGFVDIIDPVAEKLNIDVSNVYANKFIFDGDNVCGIEDTLLLQKTGKAKIIQDLKDRGVITGKTVMVGDGYTDLETQLVGAVDEYVCFCGVVNRESVKKEAKLVANNVAELENICLSLIK